MRTAPPWIASSSSSESTEGDQCFNSDNGFNGTRVSVCMIWSKKLCMQMIMEINKSVNDMSYFFRNFLFGILGDCSIMLPCIKALSYQLTYNIQWKGYIIFSSCVKREGNILNIILSGGISESYELFNRSQVIALKALLGRTSITAQHHCHYGYRIQIPRPTHSLWNYWALRNNWTVKKTCIACFNHPSVILRFVHFLLKKWSVARRAASYF